jgi:hypothetical protein
MGPHSQTGCGGGREGGGVMAEYKHRSARVIGTFLGKHFDLLMGLIGLLLLSIPIGVIYVAVHFIRKYW